MYKSLYPIRTVLVEEQLALVWGWGSEGDVFMAALIADGAVKFATGAVKGHKVGILLGSAHKFLGVEIWVLFAYEVQCRG